MTFHIFNHNERWSSVEELGNNEFSSGFCILKNYKMLLEIPKHWYAYRPRKKQR